MFNYIKGRRVEEGASLYTAALETRTRSSGFKLWERRCHLNSRKDFLTVKAARRWNLLPPRVVESPAWDVFKEEIGEAPVRSKSPRRWGAGLDGPLWSLPAL